jgi:hypothetical protein
MDILKNKWLWISLAIAVLSYILYVKFYSKEARLKALNKEESDINARNASIQSIFASVLEGTKTITAEEGKSYRAEVDKGNARIREIEKEKIDSKLIGKTLG